MSYQKVFILGNLGKDPQMRYVSSDRAVCNFNVATNESYTDSNGQQVKTTTWWRCTAWGRQAEIAHQYLKTGRQVFIEGVIKPDPVSGAPKIWYDDEGKPHTSYDLTVKRLILIGSKSDSEPNEPVFSSTNDDDEDIPF